MKVTLIPLFIAACLSCASGQIDITFTAAGDNINESTELLLSDPLVNQISLFTPPNFLEKRKTALAASEEKARELTIAVGFDAELSERNRSFTLPLSCAYKNFNFAAGLPYIHSRKIKYSDGVREVSGLGDIFLNAGYTLGTETTMLNGGLFVKLPTGDDEKMVDGRLMPLGTGATDYVAMLSSMKIFSRFAFNAKCVYKINGVSKRAHLTYTEKIANGNMFTFSGNFDYFLSSRWVAGGWIIFTSVGEGTTDIEHNDGSSETGISNKQNMILLDVAPNLFYYLWGADITLFMRIPVVTERNEANTEDSRGVTVLLKICHNL